MSLRATTERCPSALCGPRRLARPGEVCRMHGKRISAVGRRHALRWLNLSDPVRLHFLDWLIPQRVSITAHVVVGRGEVEEKISIAAKEANEKISATGQQAREQVEADAARARDRASQAADHLKARLKRPTTRHRSIGRIWPTSGLPTLPRFAKT